MPVISFVSSKGGAGKTTSAIILGTALARKHSVTMIDADENLVLNAWANQSPEAIEHIDVWAQGDEYAIHDTISRARDNSEYVIVDTKGTVSRLNAFIIGESDLVILTTGEDFAEAKEMLKTANDIQLEGRAMRRNIPIMGLFTRVRGGNKSILARETNSEVRESLDCFDVEIPFLTAFACLHRDGGSIWDYPKGSMANVDTAIEVAELFALNVKAALEWLNDDEDTEEGRNYG